MWSSDRLSYDHNMRHPPTGRQPPPVSAANPVRHRHRPDAHAAKAAVHSASAVHASLMRRPTRQHLLCLCNTCVRVDTSSDRPSARIPMRSCTRTHSLHPSRRTSTPNWPSRTAIRESSVVQVWALCHINSTTNAESTYECNRIPSPSRTAPSGRTRRRSAARAHSCTQSAWHPLSR